MTIYGKSTSLGPQTVNKSKERVRDAFPMLGQIQISFQVFHLNSITVLEKYLTTVRPPSPYYKPTTVEDEDDGPNNRILIYLPF